MVAEEYRRLLDALEDDGLRQVAISRMEGYTCDEIAGAAWLCPPDRGPAAGPDPQDLACPCRGGLMLADPHEREELDSPLARARRIHLACEQFEAEWRKGASPGSKHFRGCCCPEDRPGALFGELLPWRSSSAANVASTPAPPNTSARFPDLENLIVATFRDPPPAAARSACDRAWNSEPGPARQSSPRRDGRCRRVEERVGDYLLLEEIARGGMGIVYKARQVSG